jgi:hypothetical protein
MNYDNLTVESIAQHCAEKSGFKINKADLESQIQHLINIEQAKQLTLTDVGKSFVCTYCGINPLVDTCQQPKKCSSKKKIPAN